MKTFSKLFTLNVQDWIKGLLVAVLGAVVSVIETSITAGSFDFDWQGIWKVALAAGLAYLSKQFFTGTPKVVQIDSTKTDIIDIRTDTNGDKLHFIGNIKTK